MKLPTRLTYALRMIVEIAQGSSPDTPVRLSEISTITGISRNYLEQLAMLLKSNSLVLGTSGRRGGYRLAKPASEIKVLDIVKATIGPIQLTECIANPDCCARKSLCESRSIWSLINIQMQSVLEYYTLQDLMDEEQLEDINRQIQILRSNGHNPAGTGPSTTLVQDREEQATGEAYAHGEKVPSAPLPGASWARAGNPALAHAATHASSPPSSHDVGEVDFLETIQWLEEELRHRIGNEHGSIPLDSPNTAVMYVSNQREIKYMPFSLLAAAEIFNAAGEDWTMTAAAWDSRELFQGFMEKGASGAFNKKVLSMVRKFNSKKIVLSECGHTVWPPKWTNVQTSSVEMSIPVESFVHTMLKYLKSGKIRLDPSRITEPVTYHDPCILGRHYGITEEPRYLLSKAVSDFREMYPNRSENWCCRGGGGSTTEYNERKLEMAKIKADQILRTGAKIVATSCPNCIDGLNELLGRTKLDVKVQSVGELVARALVHKKVPKRK